MSTYVVFDGDKEMWAYQYIRGWSANARLPFHLSNSHDLDNMTSRAQSEDYVKSRLRERMRNSSEVLVLIGESTKNLFKFVKWEIELALELGLPIIAVNMNGSTVQDERCPPIMRDKCVVHIPYKMKAIQHALTNWPREYKSLSPMERVSGARYYRPEVCAQWG